jgi:glutamate formiminotransferase/formiminotetrahydrofolate cyclodeaminase
VREIGRRATELAGELAALVERDAAAYGAVSAAYKIPKTESTRPQAITEALLGAARVPLETAHAAARVAALAAALAEKGNPNAVSDAGVAALLAEAACRGAAYNVRINVAALPDRSVGQALVLEADEAVTSAAGAVALATASVERHL